MALTAPAPAAVSPKVGADLTGMIAMMGGAGTKDAQTESLIQRLRPILKLLADVEDHLVKNPDLTPVVHAIMQNRFNVKGARSRKDAGAAPQVPLAPGAAGGPVPPAMGASAAPPPPVARGVPQF
jgi:hypothetical protein